MINQSKRLIEKQVEYKQTYNLNAEAKFHISLLL